MNAHRDNYELLEQIGALIEGSLPPSAARELQALLRTDTAARQLYVRAMMLETNLEWTKKERLPRLDFISTNATSLIPITSTVIPQEIPTGTQLGRWLTPRLIGWAASILLIGYFIAIVGLLATDRVRRAEDHQLIADQPTVTALALLAHADDASWKDSDTKATPEKAPKTLQVRSGHAELKFAGGAKVVLEGPADFEIRSAKEGFLRQGKLLASVPHDAIGFTITTPSAQIVDLGTEFGVEVSKLGDTDVHVVQGAVEVDRHPFLNVTNKPSAKKRLVAGQTMRVDRAGLGDVVATSTIKSATIGATTDLVQLDLVDIVAGGDGRGHRRGLGIDPTDGRIVYMPESDFTRFNYFVGDGKYHLADDRPFVDGVGIVDPTKGAVQLDSARHTFDNFPKTNGHAYGPVWAGGSLPQGPTLEPFRSSFDGQVDYSILPHGLIALIPNKLITFNLSALRRAHRNHSLDKFSTVAGLSKPVLPVPGYREGDGRADIWAFIDGELRFSRRRFTSADGPFAIELPLSPTAQFLTFAITDGGNTPHFDWVFLGDPRIYLNSVEATPSIRKNLK